MLRSAEAAKGEVRRRGYDLGEAADDRRWEAPRNKHRFLGKIVLHLLIIGILGYFLGGHTYLGSILTSYRPDDRYWEGP